MNIIEQTQNGVTFLSADGIDAAGGAAHGFSTRLGGVSLGMWESLNLGVSRGMTPTTCGKITAAFLPPSARTVAIWPPPIRSTAA